MWKSLFGPRRNFAEIVRCEWWIYFSGDKLPDGADIMDAMIANNPHNRRGFAAIGAREGIIFSDVRLHTKLALRPKNPHLFRPDLLADLPRGFDAAALERLAEANAVAIIRYAGKGPFTDMRHVPFMVHLADAYSRMLPAHLLYDLVTETAHAPAQFHELVAEDAAVTATSQLARVALIPQEQGVVAKTLGLAKLALPEWETPPLPTDQSVIVRAALELALDEVVKNRLRENLETPSEWGCEILGANVRLQWHRTRKEALQVRVFQMN